MSRYVKVSTISFSGCHIKEKDAGVDTVDYVIADLERNINQVLPDKPDIIVLPEVCDRPVAMTVDEIKDYYNQRGERILNYLKDKAKQNNCYIAYPCVCEIDNNVYNCCQMIDRSGNVIGVYKKNYTVIGEYTNYGTLCGDEATVFQCDFGTVACIICFDLNFDELRLRIKAIKPDMVIFPSNFFGGILQKYFAFDTRSYLVSALGHANLHGGVVSPIGQRIAESTLYYNHVTMDLNLDYAVVHLDYNTAKLRNLKEKYGRSVKIEDAGNDLGCVLVSSESTEFTVKELLEEFEIPMVDEYFEQSAKHREKHLAKS